MLQIYENNKMNSNISGFKVVPWNVPQEKKIHGKLYRTSYFSMEVKL